MIHLKLEKGRIKIDLQAVSVGEDLCIIISGGDTPHIGCVTLSVPRPSLLAPTVTSATTSVLNLIGHKDDEAARYVSHTLCSGLNKNIVVTCGIHLDQITPEEIETTIDLIKEITDKLVQKIAVTP